MCNIPVLIIQYCSTDIDTRNTDIGVLVNKSWPTVLGRPPGPVIRETLPGQRERSDATPCRALRIVNRHAAAGVGVSPDLKVYTISDPEALSELVARLHLDSTLASNLREVLGLQTVGNGGR